MTPGNAATFADGGNERKYVYGVAHVNAGVLGHYQAHRTRDDAEKDLQACIGDDADCYLVRSPLATWERVPDGE